MELKLNTTTKVHMIIGLITGLWLVAFLVLIAPFDVSDLSIVNRLILMPMYGAISALGYIILIPLQNAWYRRSQGWTISFEVVFLLGYNIIVLIGSYLYYSSWWINGDFSLMHFVVSIYYPIFFVVLTLVLILRWLVFNQKLVSSTKSNTKIILTGDNKLDTLQIEADSLVGIKSADNYVEVMYMANGELSKQLLRNTLKNMELQSDQLIKVHRSYLINPLHFTKWKDANTIIVGSIEVPITKTYKNAVLELKSHP